MHHTHQLTRAPHFFTSHTWFVTGRALMQALDQKQKYTAQDQLLTKIQGKTTKKLMRTTRLPLLLLLPPQLLPLQGNDQAGGGVVGGAIVEQHTLPHRPTAVHPHHRAPPPPPPPPPHSEGVTGMATLSHSRAMPRSGAQRPEILTSSLQPSGKKSVIRGSKLVLLQ